MIEVIKMMTLIEPNTGEESIDFFNRRMKVFFPTNRRLKRFLPKRVMDDTGKLPQ